MDAIRHADAAIEADEIGAAAEENMLAIIDDFVDTGMQIRAGASAEIAAALDELHAEASLGQGAGCAHAGNTGANDGDGCVGRTSQYLPPLFKNSYSSTLCSLCSNLLLDNN